MGGQRFGDSGCTGLAHAAVVLKAAADEQGKTNAAPSTAVNTNIASSTRGLTPLEPQAPVDGLDLVKLALAARNLGPLSQEVILNSWRESTKRQYRVYLTKWVSFCDSKGGNPLLLHTEEVIAFLTHLYQQGIGYSALNTARSAISALGAIHGVNALGERPLIKRLMRGFFQIRPTGPRYESTWDVGIVLSFIKNNWPRKNLELKELTLKLVILIALVSGQRGQSIHLMKLENMIVKSDSVEFRIRDQVKTSAPGKTQPVIVLPIYKIDLDLCVAATLSDYVIRTAQFRSSSDSSLFISFVKPFKPVSRDTISRWIVQVLKLAGIDTSIYKAHSTRSASTSAASKNVPVDTILSTAGWTNAQTFAKYYKKRVVDPGLYADSILQNAAMI